MNNKLIFLGLIPVLMLLVPNVSASIVDYNDEPEEQEQCEERTDYDFLCSGSQGVTGVPFCDLYGNSTERIEQFPNLTGNRCFDRMANQVNFCETFDDLTDTYEDCRKVPGSEEFYEYLQTGGPDESCLFDVYQVKCQPDPVTDECPPDFGSNEDGRCFPAPNGEWKCPEGYHGTDDDETGQCYPNDEGCNAADLTYDGERFDYVLLTDRPDGKMDRCISLHDICGEDGEIPDHPKCEEFLEVFAEQLG